MMMLLTSFFELEVDGVALVDPHDLTPPNPDAAWLTRETPDGSTNARRIENAQADLFRMLDGWKPSEADLATAPGLRHCRIVALGGQLAMQGILDGHHPGIAAGRRVQTSVIVAVDAEAGRWVRTLSRFYRMIRDK